MVDPFISQIARNAIGQSYHCDVGIDPGNTGLIEFVSSQIAFGIRSPSQDNGQKQGFHPANVTRIWREPIGNHSSKAYSSKVTPLTLAKELVNPVTNPVPIET